MLLPMVLELFHLSLDSLDLPRAVALVDAGSHHKIFLPMGTHLSPILFEVVKRQHLVLLMLCTEICIMVHGLNHALHLTVFVFVEGQLLVSILQGRG
jgi:hypothetical protein